MTPAKSLSQILTTLQYKDYFKDEGTVYWCQGNNNHSILILKEKTDIHLDDSK